MLKISVVDKWIKYFDKHKILPDGETIESSKILGSFGQDFSTMNSDERNLLWNAIRDLKHKPNINRKNINEILYDMYSRVQQFDGHVLKKSHLNTLDSIYADLWNSELIDCSELIQIVPNYTLDVFISNSKLYCWKEFKNVNTYFLSQPEKKKFLTNNKLFGFYENVDFEYQELIKQNDEAVDPLTPFYMSRYIKKYRRDLYELIMHTIEVTNDYLFCTELISSVIQDTTPAEKEYISTNIKDTESDLYLLKKAGFIIPDILMKNMSLLNDTINA